MIDFGALEVSNLLETAAPHIPDGSHAMIQRVELPPADLGLPPHRHSGPVFAYLLEGKMLFELEGEAPREISAGEAFWEPGGDAVHYRMANLLPDGWTRFLAVCLCAPGVDMITVLDDAEVEARRDRRHPDALRS